MGIYIGIDPGASGAYAIIEESTEDGSVKVTVSPWDNENFIEALHWIAHTSSVAVACVEKVGSMPHQGVKSTFAFGKSAGFIEGVLSAFAIPYQLVPPRVWKKEYSLSSNKDESIEACERLFPNVTLLRNERCKKPHDGMAEALLMAEYARRRF